jgi:3-carboxy-cis,cis-muconate cycloisomerase
LPSDGLFDGIFSRGGAADAVSGRAWLQAMLDVELALARACARHTLIPQSAAEAIAAACVAERYDVGEIARAAAASGTPVIPLVAALRAAVGEAAAEHVHRGATSQDVIDSAAMLVARRALRPTLADLAAAADASAQLARAHRRTPILGRTLLQPAEPTTFGLKAAGWLAGIDETRAQLEDVRAHTLAVQLGGAVGTLAAFDGKGAEVAADVARQLELAEPVLPWHSIRTRPARLAGALGAVAGVLGKVAVDVTLLAQGEVGEVREGGDPARGGSSAMPHKRNPVGAVSTRACAERVPGLVATLLGAMRHEHERAAGAWQAEWETQSELLRVVGAEAAWARELLEHLEVDGERMRLNLEASGLALSALESHVDAAAALVDRALDHVQGGPR